MNLRGKLFVNCLLAGIVLVSFIATQSLRGQDDPNVEIENPPLDISIATLNCEFLVRKKVHIKFGENFDLSGEAARTWNRSGFRDARFAEACEAVAKIIKKIDADLIALVEVGDHDDVEVLRQKVAELGLNYPHVAVGDSTDGTTGQNVAVFSKHPFEKIIRQIEGRESYLAEEDDPESETDTGLSKGMQVTFLARGKRINVFVVHLASERGGAEQDAQRMAQAAIVRRTYLKPLENGEHVVLMGDLNDYRGQPTLRRIRGLDDIFEDLIQTGGPVTNRQKSGESSDDYNARIRDHWTYEFAGQQNQIDHILISQSVKNVAKRGGIQIRFIDTKETIARTQHRATDHRAVVLDLKLKD